MNLRDSDVAAILRPLLVLPGAPDLTSGLVIQTWRDVLNEHKVTILEAEHARQRILAEAKFWPAPQAMLVAVTQERHRRFAEERQRETRELIEERRALYVELPPAPEEPAELAPLDELPVPPPRERRPARLTPTGPVKLPDGRLDPRWPEHKGREAAWRRKMRYDHGLCSYESANAATLDRARAIEAKHRATGIKGVQRLF